jgi:hypothetical protein
MLRHVPPFIDTLYPMNEFLRCWEHFLPYALFFYSVFEAADEIAACYHDALASVYSVFDPNAPLAGCVDPALPDPTLDGEAAADAKLSSYAQVTLTLPSLPVVPAGAGTQYLGGAEPAPVSFAPASARLSDPRGRATNTDLPVDILERSAVGCAAESRALSPGVRFLNASRRSDLMASCARDWNAEFQAALEAPEGLEKSLALRGVAFDFVATATTYGKVRPSCRSRRLMRGLISHPGFVFPPPPLSSGVASP